MQAERDVLKEVVAELNRGIAADRGLRIDLTRWETDAFPGFHEEGPQGLIDRVLSIEDCDLLIGIFWKRFGKPVVGAKSGTAHEFRTAYVAWKRSGRPQIMVYFNQKPYTPTSRAETDQWGQVLDFKSDFPEEGLWWSYNGEFQFEKLARNHLTQFIRQCMPISGPLLKENWGNAPDVGSFYGREKESSELEQWIIGDRCRVAAVLGMGGIGKTRFSIKLAKQMRSSFEYIFWRSLQNAPALERILESCIHFLSNQQRIDLPEDRDSQIGLLLRYLRDFRCLLILDNFETILQAGGRAGHYLDGLEGYGRLLQCIGEANHESCLLLTSREKPREIAQLEGITAPVRSLQLSGLGRLEGQKILEDKGLVGSEKAWATLIDLYSGNPLALELVAEPIKLLGVDVAEFLNKEEVVVGDVHDLLDQQFYRLSKLEREILYWLAIERVAISLNDLEEDIVRQVFKGELIDALNSLQRRSMIEMIERSGKALYTLQPVIMEYVTNEFVERISEEIATEKIGVFASHAVIQAQTKDYVRNSQIQFILTPLKEGLLTTFGKEGIERKLRHMLSRLRKKKRQQPGYVAGNVLNLLVQLQCDLKDYDFSYLMIQQAYLQDVELHGVDFSHAQFAKSVFTDTFGSILSVAFSRDGEQLAAGTANGEIRLWEPDSGTPIYTYQHQEHAQGHTELVFTLGFSPDGAILASGSGDGTICLWDVSTRHCFRRLDGHKDWIRSVTFSPKGDILASGSEDTTVRLWDTRTWHCLKVLEGHTERISSIAFSSNGDILASGSEDKTIRLWVFRTGNLLNTLKKHGDRVWSVTFSPKGNILASGSEDQTVRLWEVSTGHCLKALRGHTNRVRSVAFSPNGEILIGGSEDGTVTVWDVRTGHRLKALKEHSNRVRAVAFNPNGNIFASASDDQSIRLWRVSTKQCFLTLFGHTDAVRAIAFSPDGSILASGSEDQTIRLWEVGTWNCLKVLQGHTNRVWSIAFSPDGKTLASGSEDQTIHLWEVSTGRRLKTLQGHRSRVWSVAFSPDGYMLASGSEDETVRLWNVRDRVLLYTLPDITRKVRSVAFSPDGRSLASASNDGTITLWDVETRKHLKTLRSHRPYERMNIINVSGLTEAQKAILIELGAIEDEE